MDDVLNTFHRQLNFRLRQSIRELGKRSAGLMSEGAGRGALDNSRFAFLLIDELEASWRSFLDGAFDDAREFRTATNVEKVALLPILKQKLESTLPHLIKAAGLDQPRPVWADVSDRIDDLMPLLWLRLSQYELGVGEPKETPHVTYSIRADSISGPIQQGTNHSTQNVTTISSNDLMVQLEQTVRERIEDAELRQALVALVREMATAKGTPEYVTLYQRFMASASNHMTVFLPFLPALAELLQ